MKNQALYIKKTWFTRLSGCPRISSSDNLCQSEGGVKIHTNLWTPCWRELSRKLLIREAQVYLWIPLREGVRSIYRGQVNLGSKVQYLFFFKLHHRGERGSKGRGLQTSKQRTQNLWPKDCLELCMSGTPYKIYCSVHAYRGSVNIDPVYPLNSQGVEHVICYCCDCSCCPLPSQPIRQKLLQKVVCSCAL